MVGMETKNLSSEPTSSDDLITPQTRLGHKKGVFVSKELREVLVLYTIFIK